MRRALQIVEIGMGNLARRILEAEQDFASEKSLLGTVILEGGHEVIFIYSPIVS